MQLYFVVLIVKINCYLTFKIDKEEDAWENFSASSGSVCGCASPAITLFPKLPVPRAGNGEEIQCFCEASKEKNLKNYISLCNGSYQLGLSCNKADLTHKFN